MNEFIRALGLVDWEVVWAPDETEKILGRIMLDKRVILVHNPDPKAAMRTVLHEVIELNLKPAFNVLMSLSNDLIKLVNAQAYKAKERSIDGLVDAILAPQFREFLDELSSS